MSRLGEDYDRIYEVRGELEVDVYGSPMLRWATARLCFMRHLGKRFDEGTIVSLGVDPHDHMVERFRYVGPR